MTRRPRGRYGNEAVIEDGPFITSRDEEGGREGPVIEGSLLAEYERAQCWSGRGWSVDGGGNEGGAAVSIQFTLQFSYFQSDINLKDRSTVGAFYFHLDAEMRGGRHHLPYTFLLYADLYFLLSIRVSTSSNRRD
jgi:hypothetical protein